MLGDFQNFGNSPKNGLTIEELKKEIIENLENGSNCKIKACIALNKSYTHSKNCEDWIKNAIELKIRFLQ